MTERSKAFAYFKLILLLIIIIGVPLFLYVNYSDTLFDTAWLKETVELVVTKYRGQAAAFLILAQIIQVVICIIPGQPIQFAGSYIFGVFRGYLISIIGAVIGTVISFYLAKVLGRDALEMIFDKKKIEDYHRKLNSGKGLAAVLLIYLIPGIPKDLTSYVAGISNMRIRPFLLVSTIGRSPAMFGSLLFGHFYSSRNYTAIAVLAAITVIILIISFFKRDRLISMLDDLEKIDEERHS